MTTDLVTIDLVTIDLVTIDLVTIDLVTIDLVTIDRVTAALMITDPVTAHEEPVLVEPEGRRHIARRQRELVGGDREQDGVGRRDRDLDRPGLVRTYLAGFAQDGW